MHRRRIEYLCSIECRRDTLPLLNALAAHREQWQLIISALSCWKCREREELSVHIEPKRLSCDTYRYRIKSYVDAFTSGESGIVKYKKS